MPVSASVARKPSAAAPVRRAANVAAPDRPLQTLARKCGAGGCGGGAFNGLALRTKLAVSEPGDTDEREADRTADRVLARLTGNGTGLGVPNISASPSAGGQRKCASCAAEERVSRKGEAGPVTDSQIDLNPSGGDRMSPAHQARMEVAFGQSFGAVRIHADAPADRSARDLAARAYTLGNHVFFANGEYQPGTPTGDHLLAHELTHVVQQARAGPQRQALQAKCAACEAEEASTAQPSASVQRDVFDSLPSLPSWDDVSNAATQVVDFGRGVAQDAYDSATGIAQEVWDVASRYAAALGGASVSVSGTSLIISAPGPVPVGPELDFQTALPGLGTEFPLFFGAVEIAGPVLAYGELAASLTLTPELSGQLGPCSVSGVRIVIDPLASSFSATGALSATVAVGLGAALDLALHGEVGLLIVWPDPPFALTIPVVGLEAGLEGFARGIIASHVTVGGAMRYAGGVFSLGVSERQTLGLAADLGLAGFGELQFLGQNLCRLYWPLLGWHDDLTLDSGFDFSLAIGAGAASAALSILPTTLNPMGFDALGIQIPRDMFTDDCPLCSILHRAGLMPSQLGAAWHGASAGLPHPGPVPVFPNDPGFASGAKCRGACGPDCNTCDPPADPTTHERKVCEESTGADGRSSHHFWIYPNFHHCNTHEGCRQHDACYDWSAGFGEVGPFGILGPIHRLCDLEANCNYGMPQAVGWIFGKPPYDGGMDFSDSPRTTGDCPGPCPDDRISDETTRQRICLPEVVIFEQYTPLYEVLNESTDWIELFEVPVDLPYLPPLLLGLFARGLMDADVSVRIGPLVLRNVCLDIDPVNAEHHGSADLSLWSDIEGGLALTGQLEARAGWGCLLGVIDATVLSGILGVTASARAQLSAELIDRVDVACQDGKIVLENKLTLKPCLDLLFALDAALRLALFHRFEIFHRRWHLADWAWNKCWPIELAASSSPLGDWDFDLAADRIDMVSLLKDLLVDGNSDSPGTGTSPGLPRDPARAAGKPNPCGAAVTPTDECGSNTLPLTQVSFSPGPRGQGGLVRAAPLSKCAGNTQGSQPDPAIYGAQFSCMGGIETPAGSGKKESRFWVRAHLLHGETSGSGGRDLHGPGDNMANLIISDKSFNGLMRTGPERFALERVYHPTTPEVLWYETRVTAFAPPMDFYGEEVSVNVGSWDVAANAPGPLLRSFGPITTKRAVPPCP